MPKKSTVIDVDIATAIPNGMLLATNVQKAQECQTLCTELVEHQNKVIKSKSVVGQPALVLVTRSPPC